MNDAPTPAQFLSIKAAASEFSAAGFTEPSFRWLAFNRQSNGFDRAFVKVGRRILVDKGEFIRCLRNQRAAA